MSAALPAMLPRPQRDGYAIDTEATAVAGARDNASIRCRQVGRLPYTKMSLSWVLDDEEYAIFAGWYRYDLKNGSLPATIKLLNGHSDAAQSVRFLEPLQADDLLGRWRITAAVELIAPPRLSADDLTGILATNSLDLSALGFHYLIHTSIPSRILP
jgi:hypothetical protein